jgi:hypothetical protein
LAKPWSAVEGQVLLGERRWVERMKRRLGARPVAAEVTGRKQLSVRPPLSVVLTQVSRAMKVDADTLLRPRGGRGSWARPVAMAVAWETCGLTQREIGHTFGVGPYAVSKAIARTAALAAQKGTLGKTIMKLKSNVQM